MATPLDPNQQLERERERQAREAAEQRAEDERAAEEAQANTTYNAVVMRLQQTGAQFTPAALAAALGPELDPDEVRRALERAVKAGSVAESQGRYSAAQR